MHYDTVPNEVLSDTVRQSIRIASHMANITVMADAKYLAGLLRCQL